MKVYTDANPNETCFVVVEGNTNISQIISDVTNNEAEYLAVIRALQWNQGDIDIYSDSQLVVKQLNHEWSIKESRLRELAKGVWGLCIDRKVTFTWIPRKENLAGKVLG